jgi:hypothetical protein
MSAPRLRAGSVAVTAWGPPEFGRTSIPTLSSPISRLTLSGFPWTRPNDCWFDVWTKRSIFEGSTAPNLCCPFIVCSFYQGSAGSFPAGLQRRIVDQSKEHRRFGTSAMLRSLTRCMLTATGLARPAEPPCSLIYIYSSCSGYRLILTSR